MDKQVGIGLPGLPLPREELREFLRALSKVTGLSMSYMSPGSPQPEMIIGESSFCLQMKSTSEGTERCSSSITSLRNTAVEKGDLAFELCHARMAEVAVPLVSRDGVPLGTVIIGNALIEGFSEEHREHVRGLAKQVGFESADSLVSAAAMTTVFSRSRLEALGRFVREQLVEKAASREAIEDTTEYLLQKYEELMFLYAITESLSPDSGHQKALGVILDKGAQRLNARWGLFLMAGAEGKGHNELLETYGELPWAGGVQTLSPLSDLIRATKGPALVLNPVDQTAAADLDPGSLLVVPFRLRNFREGYLIFGWDSKGMIGDSELRFTLALARQAASVLYAVQLYQELADLLFATLEALSSAVDAKDPYTHGHSRRVAEFAVMAARGLGGDSKFLTMIKIAGQLHDFGKIGIRENILTKEGKLDEVEKRAMNEHPAIGAQILAKFKSFADIVPGIRHHHERFDGGGYPDGLKGDAIPIVGRIIAVADAYDAMTTTRPYREKLEHDMALEELEKFAGTQFDPEVVGAFINAVRRNSLE